MDLTTLRKNYPGLTRENLPSGRDRLRVRVEGQPGRKITLQVPLDHPRFSEHYWSARAGTQLPHEPETYAVRRSLQWLADKYLIYLSRMVDAGQTSPATLRQRSSLLAQLCDHRTDQGDRYGDMHLNAPTHALIRARDDRADTPAQADNMMKAARAMYKWGIDAGHTDTNPASGIGKIHRSRGGAIPWTAQDLHAFKARHPAGTMAHLALTLHMFTGARSGDAIWLGRAQEFDAGGIRWIGWQPRKRGAAYVELPMAPPLRASIAAAAQIGDAYILNAHGTPFRSPDAYRNWFRKRCDDAGLHRRSTHGIRKALAELLAQDGCSEHQIMAVLSHTQPATSAIYTKGAERRAMAADAMRSIQGITW